MCKKDFLASRVDGIDCGAPCPIAASVGATSGLIRRAADGDGRNVSEEPTRFSFGR